MFGAGAACCLLDRIHRWDDGAGIHLLVTHHLHILMHSWVWAQPMSTASSGMGVHVQNIIPRNTITHVKTVTTCNPPKSNQRHCAPQQQVPRGRKDKRPLGNGCRGGHPRDRAARQAQVV